jgi:quinol monooxygenase YgiN
VQSLPSVFCAEEAMVVVIYQVRATSRAAAAEVCREFFQITGPELLGRIGGHCVVSEHDPLQVLAYEEWNSRESRDAWISSEARMNRYRRAAPLLDGEVQITLYEEP